MIQEKRNLSLVDREEQEAKPWALGLARSSEMRTVEF